MKKTLLILSLSISATVGAQDIITLTNGNTLETKVQEVTKKDVVYKKFSNQNGPNYHVDLREIEKVTYESGAVDVFNPKETSSNESSITAKFNSADLGKNILCINLPDILFQNITLSYERIIGDEGKVGLRIPFSVSLYGDKENNFTFNSYNIYYTGIDMNYYPTGQGQARIFIGPSVRYGYARVQNQYNDVFYSSSIENTGYFSFLLNSGFIWNPIKELSISSSFGVGSRRYFTAAPGNGNLTRTTASFNFSMGYRF